MQKNKLVQIKHFYNWFISCLSNSVTNVMLVRLLRAQASGSERMERLVNGSELIVVRLKESNGSSRNRPIGSAIKAFSALL